MARFNQIVTMEASAFIVTIPVRSKRHDRQQKQLCPTCPVSLGDAVFLAVFDRRHARGLFELRREIAVRAEAEPMADALNGLLPFAQRLLRLPDSLGAHIFVHGHARLPLEHPGEIGRGIAHFFRGWYRKNSACSYFKKILCVQAL